MGASERTDRAAARLDDEDDAARVGVVTQASHAERRLEGACAGGDAEHDVVDGGLIDAGADGLEVVGLGDGVVIRAEQAGGFAMEGTVLERGREDAPEGAGAQLHGLAEAG